jgi:hypothetical protein
MTAHRTIARTIGFKRPTTKRGMALLLVMIGMVVCTILTAGFLASQGTSIGIARNERDSAKCRGIAQTGIDMCYWLIRNKADWRETMSPGTWLNNAAVGEGAVSVSAADGASAASFVNDPTQPVVLSSTGTYDGRTFTLVATIRPTGGGTIFANGNFINGTISIGNSDLLTSILFPATVDSYLGGSTGLSNNAFGSADTAANALTVYFPSVFNGSYRAAPNTSISNVVNLVGFSGPLPSTDIAAEKRTPGTVIMPNTTGLTSRSPVSLFNTLSPAKQMSPGVYSGVSLSASAANFISSGIYYVTGNVSLSGSSTVLTVNNDVSAVLIVGGNFSMSGGTIKLGNANSRLAIYFTNSFTLSGGKINNAGATDHVTLFGSSTATSVTISNANTLYYGSIYAPQAAVTLQTGSPEMYGAIIANSLTVKDSSKMHFDEALKALRISNVTGGSAPPGSADYQVAITGGPGIGR